MRVTILALVIPAVLATTRQEQMGAKVADYIRDIVGVKGSKVQMVHGQAAEYSSSLAASVFAVSQVASASFLEPVINEEGNYIYSVAENAEQQQQHSDISSAADAPLKRLQAKVEISNDDFYFSQTDSYVVPDLSSFPSNSPYIKEYPGLSKKKLPPSSEEISSFI